MANHIKVPILDFDNEYLQFEKIKEEFYELQDIFHTGTTNDKVNETLDLLTSVVNLIAIMNKKYYFKPMINQWERKMIGYNKTKYKTKKRIKIKL